jgi:hypothetical protein
MSAVFSKATAQASMLSMERVAKRNFRAALRTQRLCPTNVDRSKLFVMDRLANSNVVEAARIARAIEFSRFPSLESDERDKEEGLLVRAADLIGHSEIRITCARLMRFTMNSKKSA